MIFFAVLINIVVLCIIFLFFNEKREVHIDKKDHDSPLTDNFLEPNKDKGWGVDYSQEFGLSVIEKNILNYIGENVYYQVLRLYVLRVEGIKLFLNILRQNLIKPDTYKKALDAFHYGTYFLARKYIYELFSDSLIADVRSGLSSKEMNEIRKAAKNWRDLSQDEEKAFFLEDSSRWKFFFDALVESCIDSIDFYEEIKLLVSLNDSVRIKENIYSKAYRLVLTKYKDKDISLRLYMHYLQTALDSGSSKYYTISNLNRKRLFLSVEQEDEFDQIVENFIQERDLEKAFDKLSILYEIKKRKIELDSSAIESARTDLKSVVDLLEDYLDDYTDTVGYEQSKMNDSEIPERNIVFAKLLSLFIANEYKLSRQEIDLFAKQNGVFSDWLIEGINEEFYDRLDDFVIEEDNNSYILDRSYSSVFTEYISI